METAYEILVREKAARARSEHEARMTAMAADRAAMESDNVARAAAKAAALAAAQEAALASIAREEDHPVTSRSPAHAIPPPPPRARDLSRPRKG